MIILPRRMLVILNSPWLLFWSLCWKKNRLRPKFKISECVACNAWLSEGTGAFITAFSNLGGSRFLFHQSSPRWRNRRKTVIGAAPCRPAVRRRTSSRRPRSAPYWPPNLYTSLPRPISFPYSSLRQVQPISESLCVYSDSQSACSIQCPGVCINQWVLSYWWRRLVHYRSGKSGRRKANGWARSLHVTR